MARANNVQNELLVQVGQAARVAPHGAKAAIYEQAAEQMGISLQTLHRRLQQACLRDTRKRRSDAGQIELPVEEARLISALLVESIRKNGKQMSSLRTAVERLRSNGLIRAERINPVTGEVMLLSESAIRRGLYHYRLHPEQLLAPAPAVELASRHPNHVWQIDASLSTQFYLDNTLQPMPRAEFYKNKPENFKRIERQRLWRYVITDHTSGTLYVEYVLGAESAQNLCGVLINAMQKRGDNDPFHGVPLVIMTDPGAAMTSAVFRNLCQALSIQLIINKVGNARAKGQVEQAHNIVECDFESGLRLRDKVSSLEEINSLAWQWMRVYNAIRVHSRTARTRYAVWMTIRPNELRLAPSVEVCQELAVSAPVECKVNTKLRVQFRSQQYDVSSVPGVLVGEKLLVTRNPWRDEEAAQVVVVGEDGRDTYHVIPVVQKDEFGFAGAVEIGGGYSRHAETDSEINAKVLEQLVTETTTQADAAAARKAQMVPFGGRIDPFKPVTDVVLPEYMPRRGTALDVVAPQVETPTLNTVQLAKRLRDLVPEWTGDSYAWLVEHYPHGAKEGDLDEIAAAMRRPNKNVLRVVGGE